MFIVCTWVADIGGQPRAVLSVCERKGEKGEKTGGKDSTEGRVGRCANMRACGWGFLSRDWEPGGHISLAGMEAGRLEEIAVGFLLLFLNHDAPAEQLRRKQLRWGTG